MTLEDDAKKLNKAAEELARQLVKAYALSLVELGKYLRKITKS